MKCHFLILHYSLNLKDVREKHCIMKASNFAYLSATQRIIKSSDVYWSTEIQSSMILFLRVKLQIARSDTSFQNTIAMVFSES